MALSLAPARLLDAAFWPATVWMSIAKFDDHPADDFVERSTPIMAFAVGFWLLAAGVAALWFANGSKRIFDVLLFFLPVIYGVGLWMFAARREKFER